MLRLRGGGRLSQEPFNAEFIGGWPEQPWQFGEEVEEKPPDDKDDGDEEGVKEQRLQDMKISQHLEQMGVLKTRRRRIDDPNAPEMAKQFGVQDEFSQEGDKSLVYDWMYYGTRYSGGFCSLRSSRVCALE
jgi:hypothetical protein